MRNKSVGRKQRVEGSQQTAEARLIPAMFHLYKMSKIKNTARFILIRTVLLFLSLFSFAGLVSAQGNNDTTRSMPPVEMATGLRSNGKIYVVVAVLIIILTGLFLYLIRLDRKITRLEKGENKE